MQTTETTLALQTTEADRSNADIFFDLQPVVTDWDAERQLVISGKITSKDMLLLLKEYEPLQIGDPRKHAHWVDQQRLRLALLHEAGRPLESDRTCEICANRKADALFVTSWQCSCLHCYERKQQRPSNGGRGNCEFVSPIYNPRSHSWGLLYYWSHSHDDPYIFWLADFFKSRIEAEEALAPVHYYEEWSERKYKGLQSNLDAGDLLPLDKVINLSLPLNPAQFRELLRTRIESEMNEEQAVLRYYVREALDEHDREERD